MRESVEKQKYILCNLSVIILILNDQGYFSHFLVASQWEHYILYINFSNTLSYKNIKF